MKTIIFALLSCVVLLAGCSKDSSGILPDTPDGPTPQEPTKLEIKISASIIESLPTDRGFESGDCIGLYVVDYAGAEPGALASSGNHVDNMRFTNNGAWVPDHPIYWSDETTHADLYLYYPYAGAVSAAAYPFSVRADQSAIAAYKASDFMTGKAANIAPTAGAVDIAVSHAMSRITVNLLPGAGFTAQSLASAAVSVKINGVKCSSTIDLATGVVTPEGEATAVTALHDDGRYKAIIVPQTVDEGDLITVNVDGQDFSITTAFTFEGGKSHDFNVTIAKTSGSVDVSINPWDDDGTEYGGTAQ